MLTTVWYKPQAEAHCPFSANLPWLLFPSRLSHTSWKSWTPPALQSDHNLRWRSPFWFRHNRTEDLKIHERLRDSTWWDWDTESPFLECFSMRSAWEPLFSSEGRNENIPKWVQVRMQRTETSLGGRCKSTSVFYSSGLCSRNLWQSEQTTQMHQIVCSDFIIIVIFIMHRS